MDAELLKSIWPVFSAEAREQLQAIGSQTLRLEEPAAGRPAGVLDSILRAAHSFKGSAASLGLEDYEKLAHAIEDSLTGMGADDQLSSQKTEAILRAVEAMEASIAQVDAGGSPAVAQVEALLKTLRPGEDAGVPVPEQAFLL